MPDCIYRCYAAIYYREKEKLLETSIGENQEILYKTRNTQAKYTNIKDLKILKPSTKKKMEERKQKKSKLVKFGISARLFCLSHNKSTQMVSFTFAIHSKNVIQLVESICM